MEKGVQFDEGNTLPPVRPRPMRSGFTRSLNETQNLLILGFLFSGLVIGAVYLVLLAVPEEPVLGPDVPRKGEIIPSNRSI